VLIHAFSSFLPQLKKELRLSALQKLCAIFWCEGLAFGFELRLSYRVELGRWSCPSCDTSADLEEEVFLAGR